jgi:hypothetical protein
VTNRVVAGTDTRRSVSPLRVLAFATVIVLYDGGSRPIRVACRCAAGPNVPIAGGIRRIRVAGPPG